MSGGKETSIFTNLTPTDDADPDGSYSKALSFAFEDPRIKNIAITGPYGSGKSSIIRTYEKNSTYKFLNISLASFKEDNNSIDTSLIERSILQQMLYGADANKLPYSRFKRISTPTWPLVKAMFLVLWPIILFFLYQYRNELLNIESFSLTWFFLILLIEFSVLFPVILVSNIYKASFGLSLKKFSLKNAEIETGELPENSILNRHLDEIIYFFQVTDYDVVVIEDLDRFGDPEIFVKLREINKLINDNKKACKQVKFLYALKDDMFAHKHRAKFFDFIIPVVPVINSSNSLEKMQERLKEHDFAIKVDTQFLREVSLYLDDMRLIHNIFNEFVIYYQRLKSESLDVTKLLAMMIYKNVYPSDFEGLHHGNGAFFEICKKRVEYLQKSKEQLKGQQEEIRTLIKLANNEEARNIRGLIDTYVGHIAMHVTTNQPVVGIICDNQYIALSALTTLDQFTRLLSEKNIQIATQPQHNYYRVPINKSFSDIEEEINPGETFLSRKKNIENSTETNKIKLQNEIQRIEKKITELSQLQLYQLLQIDDLGLDGLIKRCEIIDSELLVFLVKEGYLDDNYYFYISNFHEGRLSKNDRDYLLTIRNFKQPDPNQKIDTPKEVSADMREEDFGHKYVLNVTLIDYLLETNDSSSRRIKSAIGYISKKIESADEFFTAYFFAGKNLDKLINHLCREWPNIALAAISSKHEAELISYILRFVDAEHVSENMNLDNLLTEYLSQQGYLVFASDLQSPDNYNVLKALDVRFHDLISFEKNKTVLEFAHAECLYAITATNVNFILETFSASENIEAEKENYTSILSAGSKYLKRYIEENLPNYIEKVFLTLPNNIEESGATIKVIINNEMIDDDLSKKIISKQDNVFDAFDGVPENLWCHLLLEEKVVISWANISKYLKSDGFDESVVTKLLNRQNIVEPLSTSNISIEDLGEVDSKSLSNFIFYNNEISDSGYCKMIKLLPYQYHNFPAEISPEKIKCLANEKKVILTEDSFNFADNDEKLMATLICNNFNTYVKQQEIYSINDDVRELLLLSEINNEHKVAVCLGVTSQGAIESEQLSQLIASVLVANDVDCSEIDDAVLSSAIGNAQNVSDSIRLIMKCLTKWEQIKVMGVIADLPKPFSEISVYGKRPKIDNNKVNLAFTKLLEEKGYISSMKEKGDSVIINTFKSSDF